MTNDKPLGVDLVHTKKFWCFQTTVGVESYKSIAWGFRTDKRAPKASAGECPSAASRASWVVSSSYLGSLPRLLITLSYKIDALDRAEVTKPGAIAEPNGVC